MSSLTLISPWATKERLRRAEARIADLEGQLAGLLAELQPAVIQLNRNTAAIDCLDRHLRARDAAAGRPVAWY